MATQPALLSAQLNSSNLASASYDVWSGTLTIEFHSRTVFAYYNVPPEIYDGLIAATSPGRYHHSVIKNHFRYRRLV